MTEVKKVFRHSTWIVTGYEFLPIMFGYWLLPNGEQGDRGVLIFKKWLVSIARKPNGIRFSFGVVEDFKQVNNEG